MKEIKLRAWDKDARKFWFFTADELLRIFIRYWTTDTKHQTKYLDRIIVGNNFEIGEFCGVSDLRGKEMYEGDIIKQYRETSPPIIEMGTVLRSDSWVSDWKIVAPSGSSCSIPFGSGVSWEIIGNIYENQDLLK